MPISIINTSSFFKKASAEEVPDNSALLQDAKKDDKQGIQINPFFPPLWVKFCVLLVIPYIR